jgi:hypothetical protein
MNDIGRNHMVEFGLPIALVAGHRMATQARRFARNQAIVQNKLELSDEQFDNFINRWVTPLIALDDADQGCECHGVEAREVDSDTRYEVMSVLDIIDLQANLGGLDKLLNGLTDDEYNGAGELLSFTCLKCGEPFVGVAFPQSGTHGEFSPLKAFVDGLPMNDFTLSTIYRNWAPLFKYMGYAKIEADAVRDAIVTLVESHVEKDPMFGALWVPSSWHNPAVQERYTLKIQDAKGLWKMAGASNQLALIGVLIEMILWQTDDGFKPDQYAFDQLHDTDKRERFVTAMDKLNTKLWGVDEAREYDEHRMSKLLGSMRHDVDYDLLGSLHEGAI